MKSLVPATIGVVFCLGDSVYAQPRPSVQQFTHGTCSPAAANAGRIVMYINCPRITQIIVPPKSPGKLQILETVPAANEDGTPAIELYVRNIGGKSSMIHRVEVRVRKTYHLIEDDLHAAVPLEPVDINIPVDKPAPFNVSTPVASILTPEGINSVARIRLNLNFDSGWGCSIPPCASVFIADIVPIIYYDGGKKSVSGEPLMIASIGSRRILGKSDPDPDCFLYQQGRLSCRDYNLRVVRLVSALPIAKTPNLIEVITHYDVE